MLTRTDHGYSVKRSNEVLRGVSIYSGDDRGRSATDYHVVRVGMKVGTMVEWLATWDQRVQAMMEGEPLAILPAARRGMRLRENSVIVVELTTVGSPTAIQGSSVDLDLSLTGGSTGRPRALISLGQAGPAAQALADAVNDSGVAEKVARIGLADVDLPIGIPVDEYTPTVSQTITATQKVVMWGTLTVPAGVTITVNGKLIILLEPYGT